MTTEQYLLSNTTLQDFLSRMKEFAHEFDMSTLVDIWRAANRSMEGIRAKEAGCADEAAVLPLPQAMAPAAEALQKSPQTRLAHSLVPVLFGLVEVDAMMTVKQTLMEAKLAAVKSGVSASPDDSELAAICFPSSYPARPVALSSWDGERLLVVSEDEDLRILQVGPAKKGSSSGVVVPGIPDTVLQLSIGSSLPLMHAVRFNGRVLLVKGHHRAKVLRARGATYLPCLISVCESLDDILAAAPGLDRHAVVRCFQLDRPSMLRDFDRASLVHRYEARSRRRLLQVRVEISSQWLP